MMTSAPTTARGRNGATTPPSPSSPAGADPVAPGGRVVGRLERADLPHALEHRGEDRRRLRRLDRDGAAAVCDADGVVPRGPAAVEERGRGPVRVDRPAAG